jgi:hypothetical protein
MVRRFVVACLNVGAGSACGVVERPEPRAVAEAYLAGEDRLCLSDADCASTVCSFGVCAGLVSADRPWMTDAITAALAARVEAGDLTPAELRARFAEELAGDRHPGLKRARLLRGWAVVEREGALAAARPLFADADTPPALRFEAARVLLRERDGAAETWLVEQVRDKGPGLVPFLMAEWRFFAPPARSTILELVAAQGDAALHSRLLNHDRQERQTLDEREE